MLKSMSVRTTIAAIFAGLSLSAHAIADPARPINVPAGELVVALETLSRQAAVDLVFQPEQLKSFRTEGVSGTYSPQDAIRILLKGTPLQLRTDASSGAMVIAPPAARRTSSSLTDAPSSPSGEGKDGETKSFGSRLRLAQTDTPSPSQGEEPEEDRKDSSRVEEYEPSVQGIPEILVIGSKILNMDIRRTRDDPQPYVVFDRETIERSSANNVDDFLRQRLPMNTANSSTQQFNNFTSGGSSGINLRGLGSNQTLILVDGHRISNLRSGGAPSQPDVNGIPLAAIERIEVLPTTASGIYGGSATGGVVNIILRKDYNGVEFKLSYENAFEAEAPVRQADFSAGITLEGGKTSVLFGARWFEDDGLQSRDRDFASRGRAAILANNPGAFLDSATPPLGATTNIRSQNGGNLTLDPAFGGTALNSPRTFVPLGYAGAASDNGAALVANAGNYNLDLADSAQDRIGPAGSGGKMNLLNEATRKSAMVVVRRQFTDRVQAFVELNASENRSESIWHSVIGSFTLPANAPTNPFTQAVNVSVPIDLGNDGIESLTKDRRGVAGILFALPGNWMAEVDYTYHRSEFSVPSPGLPVPNPALTAAVASGAIDVLRAPDSYLSAVVPLVAHEFRPGMPTVLGDTAMRVSGPVGRLPAGPIRLSALLEARRWEAKSNDSFRPDLNSMTNFAALKQDVNSAYLEFRVPLVRKLDLQLAGRHDDYTSRFSGESASFPIGAPRPPVRHSENSTNSTDFTVALHYQPVSVLALRASYGTGFLPPEPNQILAGRVVNNTGSGAFIDPRRGNTTYAASTIINGGNPDLAPEQSKSWSAGLVFTPLREGLGPRLSVDYTRVEKSDNIVNLQSQVLVDNESLFPDRVIRGPNLPTDPPGWAGPIAELNISSVNVARAWVEAYDFQLDYRLVTSKWGSFDAYVIGTRQTRFDTQLVPGAPLEDSVGIATGVTAGSPLKLKGSAGLSWSRGGLTLGWNARYFDDYIVASPDSSAGAITIANQGNSGRVPSQTYHDAFARYRFDASGSRFWSDSEISAGVKNIFNEAPPFDAGATGAFYSLYGDPRLASYYLSFKQSF